MACSAGGDAGFFESSVPAGVGAAVFVTFTDAAAIEGAGAGTGLVWDGLFVKASSDCDAGEVGEVEEM